MKYVAVLAIGGMLVGAAGIIVYLKIDVFFRPKRLPDPRHIAL
jgi:hypothetical protein